jgi:hypothetical protein
MKAPVIRCERCQREGHTLTSVVEHLHHHACRGVDGVRAHGCPRVFPCTTASCASQEIYVCACCRIQALEAR